MAQIGEAEPAGDQHAMAAVPRSPGFCQASAVDRPVERERLEAAARGELGLVADQQQAAVDLAHEVDQQLHDRARVGRIERRGRLVGEHEARPVDQRAGDRGALALADRELCGRLAEQRVEVEPAADVAQQLGIVAALSACTSAMFWRTVRNGSSAPVCGR